MRRDMTNEKTVSRRALAVLRLFRHAPSWRVEWVWFTASSSLTVDDVRWTMDRSISATDAGLLASINLFTEADFTLRQTRRLGSVVFAPLRSELVAAGFEDHSQFERGHAQGLFFRSIESVKDVRREWRFLQALHVSAALRGRVLPRRSAVPRRKKNVTGLAFARLRRDPVLMSHLRMVRLVRSIRGRVRGVPWRGSLALMGDPFCMQAIVHFWPDTKDRALSRNTRSMLPSMGRVLLSRGYDDWGDGAFCLPTLGPVSLEQEEAFLRRQTLRSLASAGEIAHG